MYKGQLDKDKTPKHKKRFRQVCTFSFKRQVVIDYFPQILIGGAEDA